MKEDLTPVFDEYNLKVNSLSKKRHLIIAHTDKGLFALNKKYISQDKLFYINNIKKSLVLSGFKDFQQEVLTKDYAPFISFKDEVYALYPYKFNREMTFESDEDVLSCLSLLGRLHNKSKVNTNANLFLEYSKKLQELRKLKRNVSLKSKFTDFDVLFIKSYETYYQMGSNALEILKNAGDVKACLCLNDIKEESFLINDDYVLIDNLDKCLYNHFSLDLSHFILRYIRKHKPQYMTLNSLLDTYFSYNPPSKQDVIALYASIAFPLKYIDLIRQTYNKRQSLIPLSTISKLRKTIDMKEEIANYLNKSHMEKYF